MEAPERPEVPEDEQKEWATEAGEAAHANALELPLSQAQLRQAIDELAKVQKSLDKLRAPALLHCNDTYVALVGQVNALRDRLVVSAGPMRAGHVKEQLDTIASSLNEFSERLAVPPEADGPDAASMILKDLETALGGAYRATGLR